MNEAGKGIDVPLAILELLTSAGWYPERAVDIGPYKAAYEAEDIPWTDHVEMFLREFGDLVIKYTTPLGDYDVLEFCAQQAATGMGDQERRPFEELSGRTFLCPLGHYQFGTTMIFMDPRGEVIGGSDEHTAVLGCSGWSAVCNILTAEHREIIGRFPAFTELLPDAPVTEVRQTSNQPTFSGVQIPTSQLLRHGDTKPAYRMLDDSITGYLKPRGFKRVPQKRSVSWTLPLPGSTQGSNVIFKLVDLSSGETEFGVRAEWLSEHASQLPWNTSRKLKVNNVVFLSQVFRDFETGLPAILDSLRGIEF